jgi:hypothetical protein
MSNGILLPHEVAQIVKLGESIGKERLELDMIDQMKIMEQRRFELAKAAMQGMLSRKDLGTPSMIVSQAVFYADSMLAALEDKE